MSRAGGGLELGDAVIETAVEQQEAGVGRQESLGLNRNATLQESFQNVQAALGNQAGKGPWDFLADLGQKLLPQLGIGLCLDNAGQGRTTGAAVFEQFPEKPPAFPWRR